MESFTLEKKTIVELADQSSREEMRYKKVTCYLVCCSCGLHACKQEADACHEQDMVEGSHGDEDAVHKYN